MPNDQQVLDALLNDKSVAEVTEQSVNNNQENASDQQSAISNQKPEPTEVPNDSTKPVETETTKEPEQAAVVPESWISQASKSIGQDFKTEDELKNFFNKAKGYDELETQKLTLNQELEKYKAEANPFANDHIKKLNELVKGGASDQQIKLFQDINSIGEIKALSPLEAKKLALRYENDLTPAQAETIIKAQYKLDPELYDQDTVDAETIRLKIDAKKDFQYLDELQTKASTNPALAKEEDYKAKIADYTKQVEPFAKSIRESLTAIKGVNLNGKTGADAFTTDLPVSEDSLSKIEDSVMQYAVMNQIPMNEAGKANIMEFANNLMWIANKENFAIHIASKTEERIRAEFHNPSTIQRGQDNPVADSKEAKERADFERILNS